jgi:hypothetical protein
LTVSTLTVIGLKAALKERNLKVSGKKAVLQDRLQSAIDEEEEDENDDEEDDDEDEDPLTPPTSATKKRKRADDEDDVAEAAVDPKRLKVGELRAALLAHNVELKSRVLKKDLIDMYTLTMATDAANNGANGISTE